MLRIRLRHVGANKQPSFRIVVAEKSAPRDGRFVESIGFYNPRTEPATIHYQEDRALHWLSVGAQPSEAVARLFRNGGTMDRLERLKAGESLEVILAEAEAEAVAEEEAQEITPEVSESVEAAGDAEGEALEAETAQAEAAPEAEASSEAEVTEAEATEPETVEVAEAEIENVTEQDESVDTSEDTEAEQEDA